MNMCFFFTSPPSSYLLKSFAVPNFLPHTIIFFQYESIEIDWRMGFFLSFSSVLYLLFVVAFFLYLCTSWSITSRTFYCCNTHTRTLPNYIYDLRRFSLNYIQQNKSKTTTTKMYIIAFLVFNTACIVQSFECDPKILSIHQPHSLCYSLYCTCVSIELVYFFRPFIRLSCVLKFHCLIEFNGIRIFLFTHCKKSDKIVLFYCCVLYVFFFHSFLFSSVLEDSRREIIGNAAVSMRDYVIHNTMYHHNQYAHTYAIY